MQTANHAYILGRVLVVDDEKNIGLVIETMLDRAGFEVVTFSDSQAALDAIKDEEFDAVITDLYMPGADGMEVLNLCKAIAPPPPVIMITAFGTVDAAVAALKQGAFDFITKPFDQKELIETVKKATETSRQRRSEPTEGFEVSRFIEKVSETKAPVLLVGEAGTGKESIALQIHQKADRKGTAPFVKVSTAAVPQDMLEKELFGSGPKPAKTELARGGTLFIDEVAGLPEPVQVKLLGLLTSIPDVRFLFASSSDLSSLKASGKLTTGLANRFEGLSLKIPPLRERKEEIEGFARSLVKSLAIKHGRDTDSIETACIEVFQKFGWPGNLKQLENVIERMVLGAAPGPEGKTLRAQDLPEELRTISGSQEPAPTLSFKETVRRETQKLERDLIEQALKETRGNVTRAADRLGLSRKGLQLKMKELGVKRPFH